MSEKSDKWRDQEAQRVMDVIDQIKESASPETVEANKDAWDNIHNGYEASIDKSLDDPEPEETEDSSDTTDTSDDSNVSDDESTDDED